MSAMGLRKSRKPRICYVNPPVLLKRPVSEIIGKLNNQGYKTSLVIPKKAFKKKHISLHHFKNIAKSKVYAYSIVYPPFVKAEQPLPITPMFCINSWKALKNNDIIHMWVPYYFTSFNIILTKRLFFPKKKLILTMDTVPGHSFSMGRFWDTMFKIYNKLFSWLIYGTPDIIILYGESMVKYALKAGVPKQKIRVISTGIDTYKASANVTGKKKSSKEKSNIRKELSIKPKTKIILFVGILIHRKGVDTMIKVAKEMRKKDVVFLLVSDGPQKKEYEQRVKELKLEKKVFFLGWRTDMHSLYKHSDVLFLPSRGEGLPGVVMEAMTHSLPVVSTRIPCTTDLVKEGENGYLCRINDVKGFTDKLKKLLSSKDLRKRMGINGKNKIKEYDWKKVIKKYIRLYEQV